MQGRGLSVTGLILRYVHSAGRGQLEHSYCYARIEMGIGRCRGDGLVDAIGGMNDSGPPSTANVYAYDPAADTCSVVSPLPAGPRRNLAAATDFAGRIYAIGVYTPEFPLATVERYDPSLG